MNSESRGTGVRDSSHRGEHITTPQERVEKQIYSPVMSEETIVQRISHISEAQHKDRDTMLS